MKPAARMPALPDARKSALTLFEEFKNFALKGNVIDLAVAVIIGAAFAKVVDSLVKHIIMPAISILLPTEQSYLAWKVVIAGTEIPYGLFLGELVSFLLVALALFIFIVKLLGWILRIKKAEAEVKAPPAPSPEERLLTEIRDLLRTQQSPGRSA